MVPLVQLVRASDCGSECHGFESHRAPKEVPIVTRLSELFAFMKTLLYRPASKGVGLIFLSHTAYTTFCSNSHKLPIPSTQVVTGAFYGIF